jgi:hypothetical protein
MWFRTKDVKSPNLPCRIRKFVSVVLKRITGKTWTQFLASLGTCSTSNSSFVNFVCLFLAYLMALSVAQTIAPKVLSNPRLGTCLIYIYDSCFPRVAAKLVYCAVQFLFPTARLIQRFHICAFWLYGGRPAPLIAHVGDNKWMVREHGTNTSERGEPSHQVHFKNTFIVQMSYFVQ